MGKEEKSIVTESALVSCRRSRCRRRALHFGGSLLFVSFFVILLLFVKYANTAILQSLNHAIGAVAGIHLNGIGKGLSFIIACPDTRIVSTGTGTGRTA